MMRYYKPLSTLAVAALCFGGLCVSRPANAQTTLVFDNFDGAITLLRGAGSSISTTLSVANTTTIDRIGVDTNNQSAGNYKFLIFNDANGALLFVSAPKAFGADTGSALNEKDSDIFSFTLLAGNVYDIGYIADIAVTNSLDFNATSQNGLTNSNTNSNFEGYASPADSAKGGVDTNLRLYVQDSSVTPEGSSLLLLCGGLLPLGGLGFWRRHTRSQVQSFPIMFRRRSV